MTFEEEAKERAGKLEEILTLGIYDNEEDLRYDEGYNSGEVAGYEDGFIDGANFGYGKGKSEAKEIIKDLLSLKSTVSSAEDVRKRFSVRERAEEFLKEE